MTAGKSDNLEKDKTLFYELVHRLSHDRAINAIIFAADDLNQWTRDISEYIAAAHLEIRPDLAGAIK